MNVNGIELIVNLDKALNPWEVFRIRCFVNLKNHPQTHIKIFIKLKYNKKSKIKGSFQNQ
jgi:hypothetical protein